MNLEEIAPDLPKIQEPKLDVLIHVGKPPNSTTIKENSQVLKDQCEYFRTLLNDKSVIKNDGWMEINLPSISPETFGCQQDDGKSTLDRLIALDELGIKELLGPGQDYLIKNQSGWIRDNFSLVYKTTIKIPSLDSLRKYILGILRQQPRLLLNPRGVKYLEKDVLIWLLKKEDVQMDELEIWQNVIAWGIAQNPLLGPKISSWTSEEINERFADFSRPKSGYFPFMFSSKYIYYGKNAIKLSKSRPSFGRTDLQIRDGTCFCKVCDYDKAITW
ncbi:6693_t:CDS:2, partial [Racocetra fulgida]